MEMIDITKLSPLLQILIKLELENNGVNLELLSIKKDLVKVKEKINQGTDLSSYTDSLTVDDIAKILHIGRVQAYNLVHRQDFPKLKIGKRIVIVKSAFVNWLNFESLKNK